MTFESALFWSAHNGKLDMIENGADIHENDDFILRECVEKGNLEITKYLVEHGADIHANNDFALRKSPENGNINMVQYLVEHGANIHSENDFALCTSEREHLSKAIYSFEEDYHADNEDALRASARKGNLGVVKYLVQQGANIHADNDYALRMSRLNGHLHVVKYLMDLGYKNSSDQ